MKQEKKKKEREVKKENEETSKRTQPAVDGKCWWCLRPQEPDVETWHGYLLFGALYQLPYGVLTMWATANALPYNLHFFCSRLSSVRAGKKIIM